MDIDYEIDEEGKLRAIPDRAATGNELNAIQVFASDNSYFESISDEEILINESYSEISLPLRLRSDAGYDPTNYNYNYVTFSLQEFISGFGSKAIATVEFTDNRNGKVTITKYETDEVILEVGFVYSVINEDTEYKTYSFELHGEATGTEVENLAIRKMELRYENTSLYVTVEYQTESGSVLSTNINVDMTNPL